MTFWPGITPANKFHIGNGADGKHYWLTPPDLYVSVGPGTGRHIACFILRAAA